MSDLGIVVGVNEYCALQPLKGPVEDAEGFYSWLISPNGGGLKGEGHDIHRIVSPANWITSDPHPTRNEIERVLQDLLRRAITGEQPIGSRLFIYLAGHGFNDPNMIDEVALYSSENLPALPAYLAASWYAAELRRLYAFEQIALIMDCCRTTSLICPVRAPQSLQVATHSNAAKVKTFVAYSTGYGTGARESKVNGATKGIFTRAFLEALRSAPPNHFGRLTGTKVKQFVHNRMERPQTADIAADSNKEFVFVENHKPGFAETKFRLVAGVPQKVTISGGPDNVVDEFETPPEFSRPLPPGFYKIQAGGVSKLFESPTHAVIEI